MNTIMNTSNFYPQNTEKTKRRIKNVDPEIITMYTFCFLKRNFQCCTVFDCDTEIEEMHQGKSELV